MLILQENLEFLMARENLPLKKGNFGPMGQNDGNFLFVLINARANGDYFRVKTSHISLGHPVVHANMYCLSVIVIAYVHIGLDK